VPASYQPFTVLIASRQELASVTSDGVTLTRDRRALILATMFTSSSLDEQRAAALRGR